MAEPNTVYDSDDGDYAARHKVPAGDPSDPRGDLGKAESKGLYNSGGDGGSGGAVKPNGLGAAEKKADNDFQFNPRDKSQRGNLRLVLKAAGKHRKAMLIGGGATTGIVGLVVVVFLMLIPLKIEHIVNNLQTRFFSTSENAVERQSENMLSMYIKRHVLPALSKCSGSTIDKNCNPEFGESNNPVDALYKGWSNNRLENKLATKYGIEFQYNKHTNKYYMKAPGITNPNGDDISKFADPRNPSEFDKNLFTQVSRGQARQAVRDAMQNETRWKKVMYRFKVGRLLEEKYGIKRCVVYCGKRDALADKVDAKKNAAQIFLTQRVIVPRTETMGIVMECLLNPSCDPMNTSPSPAGDGSSESAGTPESDTEREVRTNLVSLANSYGVTDKDAVDKMIKDYGDISEKGYQKYLLGKVLEKIGMSELTDQIVDTAPLIGWANKAASTISALDGAGPKIKKLSYVTNASAAVSMFMVYRSYSDEVHTGHVDSTEVGSMVKSLGPGNQGGANDPELGGTASAESTPLYSALMNGQDGGSTTSLLDDVLPSRAYAAGSSESSSNASNDYKCDNGNPPTGLVCHTLGGGSALFDSIHNILHTPPIGYITDIAHVWSGIVGKTLGFVGNLFGSALTAIPGVGSLVQNASDFVSKIAQPFFTMLTDKIVPKMFASNMSGGSRFEGMAAGAAVGGKDSCDQNGCQKVPKAAYMQTVNEQLAQAQKEFDSRPMFARMFSTDTPYSLVSRVAMATPLDTQGAAQTGFASLLASPLSAIAHGFGSILSGHKAFAATSADAADPFQIGTNDFPSGKIPADARAYWDAHCSDNASQAYQNDADYNDPNLSYNKNTSVNPNTGMPEHNVSNPCLLIKNAVGDVGATSDSGLLTSDEQQTLNGGKSSGSADSGSTENSGSLPSGSAQDLAKQLQPFIQQGKIKCGTAAGGTGPADCLDIQNTAKGEAIGGNCKSKGLTPHLLGLILGLVKDKGWTLGISAICSNHHPEGDGPYAGHSYGSTADFSIENGASGAAAASNEKFVNDVADLLSASGGSFGQVGKCHAIYASQKNSKFTTFDDACNHQHVRAAP